MARGVCRAAGAARLGVLVTAMVDERLRTPDLSLPDEACAGERAAPRAGLQLPAFITRATSSGGRAAGADLDGTVRSRSNWSNWLDGTTRSRRHDEREAMETTQVSGAGAPACTSWDGAVSATLEFPEASGASLAEGAAGGYETGGDAGDAGAAGAGAGGGAGWYTSELVQPDARDSALLYSLVFGEPFQVAPSSRRPTCSPTPAPRAPSRSAVARGRARPRGASAPQAKGAARGMARAASGAGVDSESGKSSLQGDESLANLRSRAESVLYHHSRRAPAPPPPRLSTTASPHAPLHPRDARPDRLERPTVGGSQVPLSRQAPSYCSPYYSPYCTLSRQAAAPAALQGLPRVQGAPSKQGVSHSQQSALVKRLTHVVCVHVNMFVQNHHMWNAGSWDQMGFQGARAASHKQKLQRFRSD